MAPRTMGTFDMFLVPSQALMTKDNECNEGTRWFIKEEVGLSLVLVTFSRFLLHNQVSMKENKEISEEENNENEKYKMLEVPCISGKPRTSN